MSVEEQECKILTVCITNYKFTEFELSIACLRRYFRRTSERSTASFHSNRLLPSYHVNSDRFPLYLPISIHEKAYPICSMELFSRREGGTQRSSTGTRYILYKYSGFPCLRRYSGRTQENNFLITTDARRSTSSTDPVLSICTSKSEHRRKKIHGLLLTSASLFCAL
jgi:hypothetical protein